MFDRGSLTDKILAHLSAGSILVGDHVAPKAGGWSQGQPNVGEFRAYSVLASGSVGATPSGLLTGRFDHRANYTIRTYGATREQTDAIALTIRNLFMDTPRDGFPDFVAQNFWCNQIGACERINDNDPAAWREQDAFTVECYAQ